MCVSLSDHYYNCLACLFFILVAIRVGLDADLSIDTKDRISRIVKPDYDIVSLCPKRFLCMSSSDPTNKLLGIYCYGYSFTQREIPW